jgi:hypothetical protein
MPTPRLSQQSDGTPDLTFLEYIKTDAPEQFTGGSLQFAAELGLTESELASLQRQLPSKGLKCSRLGPVIFKSGEFMVVSADVGEGGVFTRGVVGQGRAPLVSRSKAAVSIALKPEGATFIKNALADTNYRVYTAFDMVYEGLSNEYSATATIDWSKVRSFFESERRYRIYRRREVSFGPIRWVWYVNLGERQESRLSDHLRAQGAIEIEKIGSDSSLDPILEMLTERVMETMTEVTLDLPEMTSEMGEDPSAAGTMPYGTRIKVKSVSQSGRFTITLKGRQRVERPTGPMTADIGSTLRRLRDDRRIHRLIDLDDPDFQARGVAVSLDIENADSFGDYINYATVSLRKRYRDPQRPAKSGELSFNQKTFQESTNTLEWTYPLLGEDVMKGGMEYDYRVGWSFAGGARIETNWQTTDLPTLVLSPPLWSRTLDLAIDSSNAEERGVRFIQVQIKNRIAGRERLREIKVNPNDNPWVTYRYHHPEGDLSYSYQIVWFLDDGQKTSSGWRTSTDPFVDLNLRDAEVSS